MYMYVYIYIYMYIFIYTYVVKLYWHGSNFTCCLLACLWLATYYAMPLHTKLLPMCWRLAEQQPCLGSLPARISIPF